MSIERAATSAPLSTMQLLVAELVGLGYQAQEIAGVLGIHKDTVRYHVKMASQKIPGDLTAQARVVAWARGATMDVLVAGTLRREVRDRQRRSSRSHSSRIAQVTGPP